ncbi:glycoside hydrolase family 32 protein [Amphibacillus sediminis]|uniref:glycoside hydrolase family 32 protein n=1 Tax=Amphibacillus sediminis TaxID=360185 RepID=UPI00082F56DF|nr:sucrose-6-phosphate hydrolase [Amphibacillus sediminis]
MNPLQQELRLGIASKQPELVHKVKQDFWRLIYHEMPPTGWLNDPNGVCQFSGVYHLFYQYSPIDPEGGLKYWGHKTSKDLVHFKEEEIALFPDHPADVHGVYSGSAFIKQEVIHFFYTGNVRYQGDYDYITEGREQNILHFTSKDGYSFSEKKLLIGADHYPAGFTKHIRDPKVFEKDGFYYMILGTRTNDAEGQIIVYQSTNLADWSFRGIFLKSLPKMGYMWECPDYFEIGDQAILLMSPQGIEVDGLHYQNVYQSGYFFGRTNWEKVNFQPSSPFRELDHGFDFYAPQTFEDEQGRRIMWGWMGLPDIEPTYSNPTIERGWQHAMTMPRELTIKDGKLMQRPLSEFQVLRDQLVTCKLEVGKRNRANQLSGEVYEMVIDVLDLGEGLSIHLRQDTLINYDAGQQILTLELGESGYGRNKRSVLVESLTQLHIFSDTSSLEIFINDGEYVMTTRLYPLEGQDKIEFSGEACLAIRKWNLSKKD